MIASTSGFSRSSKVADRQFSARPASPKVMLGTRSRTSTVCQAGGSGMISFSRATGTGLTSFRSTTESSGGPPSGGSRGSGGGGAGGGGSGGPVGDGPHPLQPWTYLFAALLAVGGLLGYIRKGSSTSLTAGMSAGLILALCARSMSSLAAVGPARFAFGLCTVLGIVMGSRTAQSGKVMPTGIVALGALALAGGFLVVGI